MFPAAELFGQNARFSRTEPCRSPTPTSPAPAWSAMPRSSRPTAEPLTCISARMVSVPFVRVLGRFPQQTPLEIGCKMLIDAMDAQLARKTGGRITPDTWGLAALCSSSCTYFCEVALKTLQASLTGGAYAPGHDLAPLYDDVARRSGEADALDRSLRDQLRRAHGAHSARQRHPEGAVCPGRRCALGAAEAHPNLPQDIVQAAGWSP